MAFGLLGFVIAVCVNSSVDVINTIDTLSISEHNTWMYLNPTVNKKESSMSLFCECKNLFFPQSQQKVQFNHSD